MFYNNLISNKNIQWSFSSTTYRGWTVLCICVYVCVYTHLCAYTYMYVHAYMHRFIHTTLDTRMLLICSYIDTHAHARTHAHLYNFSSKIYHWLLSIQPAPNCDNIWISRPTSPLHLSHCNSTIIIYTNIISNRSGHLPSFHAWYKGEIVLQWDIQLPVLIVNTW